MNKSEVDKLIKDIAADLEKNAMPFESWVYEVKTTHQIIREHLTKFNNVVLDDVMLSLPSDEEVTNEMKKLPYTKHLDDGQYNDGVIAGFEQGVEYVLKKARGQ